jgi:hypothetical protein
VADQPAAAGLTLSERYEQLRQVALGGQAEGWRHGLGVLTARGMAAWMRAWASAVPPAPAPVAAGRSRALSVRGDSAGEVVAVLASMALAHS